MCDIRPDKTYDLSVRTEVGRKSTTKCMQVGLWRPTEQFKVCDHHKKTLYPVTRTPLMPQSTTGHDPQPIPFLSTSSLNIFNSSIISEEHDYKRCFGTGSCKNFIYCWSESFNFPDVANIKLLMYVCIWGGHKIQRLHREIQLSIITDVKFLVTDHSGCAV
jgi:hypothetical protein